MKVKVKKLHPEAVLPKYAYSGDAGMDLTAISKTQSDAHRYSYGTGLAFEIPKNHVGLLFPRSSVYKKDLILTNCVGVLDSNYRGEVMFNFSSYGILREYEIGDRIGQLLILPYPEIELEEVTELSETERGQQGFGSSDVSTSVNSGNVHTEYGK